MKHDTQNNLNKKRFRSFLSFERWDKTRFETEISSYSSHKESQRCFQCRIFFQKIEFLFFFTQWLFSELDIFDDSIIDEKAHEFEKEFFISDAFSSKRLTIESKESDSEKLSTKKTKKTKIESQYSYSECSFFETKNSTKEHATQMNSSLKFFRNQTSREFFNSSRFFLKMNTISTNQKNKRTHNQNLQELQNRVDQ